MAQGKAAKMEISPRAKTLLIIEGPAGCGKTTLTTGIEGGSTIPVVRSSLGKRTIDSAEAIIRSSINDYTKLISALSIPQPLVVIERFMISQLVYGGLRNPGLRLPSSEYISSVLVDAVQSARHDLRIRGAESEGIQVPSASLRFLFIIPTVAQLTDRRRSGGKEYPWPAELELSKYHEVYTRLSFPKRKFRLDQTDQESVKEFLWNLQRLSTGSSSTGFAVSPEQDSFLTDE